MEKSTLAFEIKEKEGKESWLESTERSSDVSWKKSTTIKSSTLSNHRSRWFEIKVRENKIWLESVECFVERRAGYIRVWIDSFFIETLHPLLVRAARCLRPNISDSLRKHICLRTNTAKARGEGEAEPSWRCLEAKWNAECVWDCLHCRTIFRVFWRTRAERGAPLFYLASPSLHPPFLPSFASFLFSPRSLVHLSSLHPRFLIFLHEKFQFSNYFESSGKNARW